MEEKRIQRLPRLKIYVWASWWFELNPYRIETVQTTESARSPSPSGQMPSLLCDYDADEKNISHILLLT